MRILGVDPGLNATGFGVVDVRQGQLTLVDAGFIEPQEKKRIDLRLATIHHMLEKVIIQNKPQVLVLEKIYAHAKHPATSSILGHARGVVCLLAAQQGIPLVELPVKRMRIALLGNGNASKEQVRAFVQRLLRIEHVKLTLDTSDALALALGHAHMLKFKLL